MDKDAKLIFESYKNRVVLNEAVAGAATAVASIPSTILAAIAGTAGAVVIGNEIKKTYDKLTGQEQISYQKKVEQLKNILEKSDTSARGCYELINFITSNSTDKILIEFAQVHKQILDSANSLTENRGWDKEQLESLVYQAEGANTQLLNHAKQKGLDPAAIRALGGEMRKAFKAGQEASGGGGGGGGKPQPPQPPKRGGWFAALMTGLGALTGGIIAAIWNKVSGANWKFLSFAALIVVSMYPELAKHFTKGITQAGSEAIEGAKEGIGLPTPPQSSPSGGGKWLPKQQPSTPSPEAAPTPFPVIRGNSNETPEDWKGEFLPKPKRS